MRRAIVLIGVPIGVGVIATAIALNSRHSGDAFTLDQRALRPYDQRRAVEHLVATAPAPASPRLYGRASASCQPGGRGVRQNPWTCTLSYRSGLTLHYVVTISPSGAYVGEGPVHKNGFFNTIHGCCLPAP